MDDEQFERLKARMAPGMPAAVAFPEFAKTAEKIDRWRDVYGVEFVDEVLELSKTSILDLDQSFKAVQQKWQAKRRVVVAPSYHRFVTWAKIDNTDPWIYPHAPRLIVVTDADSAQRLRGTRKRDGDRLIMLGLPRWPHSESIQRVLRETGWLE